MDKEKSIKFEWDEPKGRSNLKKHKVSFEEAKGAFYDPNARIIPDPELNNDEDRFILLGVTDRLRLLVVCHCYREGDSVIRIISARKANKKEQAVYEEHLL